MTLPIRQTAVYYLAFILLGLSSALLGPTLNVLAEHTGSTLGAISIVFTTYSVGYLLGSALAGRVYDRFRGHPMAAGCLVLSGALNLLIPELRALWALLAIQLLLGVVFAVVDVGCNTLLVWAHGSKVGPYMNGLHLFFGVGALLAPVLIALMLANQIDVRWAYRAAGLAVLPGALALWRTPSPHHPETVAHVGGSPRATSNRLIAWICVFFFFIVALETSVTGWVFTYAKAYGISEVTAAAITSGFWASFTIGRLLGIPIAARVGPSVILSVDLAMCVAAGLTLLAGAGSEWSIWLGTLLAGLGVASAFATMLTYAETRMAISGAITGWFFVGVSAGAMIVPWSIGQAFERWGPTMVPITLVAVSLASTAIFAIISRSKYIPSSAAPVLESRQVV